MVARIAMIALGAMCCIFSGCGCSKENDDGTPSRMDDAAYTNRLMEIHRSRNAVAAKVAALRGRIEKLGSEAKGSPEYIDLTNQLAQCMAESDRLRNTAVNAIRSRLLKESNQKDNFKK